MEAKHTPGPWRYESTSGSNYARIFFSADEEDGDNLRGYCGEANARLIAAAPELLEALRMWLDIHETPAGFAGKYGKAFDDALAAQQLKVDAAASAARAAIAKSTGGAA